MSTHEAVAEVIKAVGFDAMAREYVERPELRERIITAMTRNIANDRRFGQQKAKEFARLARLANNVTGDYR